MYSYKFIGASVGHCASVIGCEKAPNLVKSKLGLQNMWQQTIYFKGEKRHLSALDDLAVFSTSLAQVTKKVIDDGHKFITIGGDHSCAIGTWSGAHEAYGELGLIWIDAHMDAHTPESSHSGNLHGMPVSVLMGYGDDKLTKILSVNPKLKPENIILIGIRSFEAPEQKLLQKLGVKVLMMEDVHKRGFQHCYAEALKYFEDKKLSFGVSFDLDGLDPRYLGALGTPVEDGIVLEEVLKAFKSMPKKHFIGLEIAEYNPSLDKNDKGIGVIKNILSALAGEDYFLLRNYCNMGSVEA